MITNIYANKYVSVTELKRNYQTVLSTAGDSPIAVLNHNKPEAYLVSAAYYEALLTRLEDLEDLEDSILARDRADGPFEKVALSDL